MTTEPGYQAPKPRQEGGTTRSREETEERILDAAIALMRSSGTSNISLRQVAEAAGVSHPLVLRYFGSKQGLASAVAQSMDGSIPRSPMSLAPLAMVAAASKASYADRDVRRGYVQMAVCSSPDTDPGFDQTPSRELLERLQRFQERTVSLDAEQPVDRRVASAGIAALAVGWLLTEKWLERTFGLAEIDEKTMADHYARLCGYMAELSLPAPALRQKDESPAPP
jgi:AcrR family transcriptional regulator